MGEKKRSSLERKLKKAIAQTIFKKIGWRYHRGPASRFLREPLQLRAFKKTPITV